MAVNIGTMKLVWMMMAMNMAAGLVAVLADNHLLLPPLPSKHFSSLSPTPAPQYHPLQADFRIPHMAKIHLHPKVLLTYICVFEWHDICSCLGLPTSHFHQA